MDTIIFGAGNAGQHLYEEIIENTDDFNVIAFLDNKVFADQESSTLDPKPEGVAGFNAFMDSYIKNNGGYIG